MIFDKAKYAVGAGCAVLCWLSGWYFRGVYTDRIVSDIHADYAQKTAQILAEQDKERLKVIEQYEAQLKVLGEAITERDNDIEAIKISRADLSAQLKRMRESVDKIVGNPVTVEIRKIGSACDACKRAVADLRRMAAEGAKLHVEGAELLGDITAELGELTADRRATSKILKGQGQK